MSCVNFFCARKNFAKYLDVPPANFFCTLRLNFPTNIVIPPLVSESLEEAKFVKLRWVPLRRFSALWNFDKKILLNPLQMQRILKNANSLKLRDNNTLSTRTIFLKKHQNHVFGIPTTHFAKHQEIFFNENEDQVFS